MPKSVNGLYAFVFSAAVVFLLAACTPASQPPVGTAAAGTFAPQARDVPTLAPPAWVPAGENITLTNVPSIAYLGRLDAQGVPSTVFAYAFSPDGSRLAGLNNEQLISWDLITGKLLFNTTRSDAARLYYGADKTEIYTVDGAGKIRVYSTESGQITQTLEGQPSFNGADDYDPDDGLLALGGHDGAVKVWDVKARQSLVTIQANTVSITSVAFSSDYSMLATVGVDSTVKIWDWRAKKLVSEIKAAAFKVMFAPDGSQIALGENKQISIWNVQDGKLAATLTTGPRAQTDTLLYSPDGQYLVNGGSIQTLTVWDTKTGKLINTLPDAGGDVNSVAFSHDGSMLVTSVLGGDVNLWNLSTMRDPALSRATLNVGTRQILYSSWSPDGFILLLVDATGPIQIWGIAAPPAPTPEATATPVS